MAFALVANIDAAPGENGGTTSAIDTTGADLLIFPVGSWDVNTAGDETPSDSKSNTWSGRTLYEAGQSAARIFDSVPSSVGASHTFTYSDTTSYPVLSPSAWSGAAAVPFDQQNGATGTSTSPSPGSVTPTEDNELIITTITFNGASGGITPPTGFTMPDSQEFSSGVNMGFAVAYKVQTTAGSETPTWTLGNSRAWAATVATYKAAAGGGGGGLVIPVAMAQYRQRWN